MSKEAMKLALEALESCGYENHGAHNAEFDGDKVDVAITALQKALTEQPAQQEPTEWLTGCPECGMDSCDCDEGTYNPPAQQEPVATLWKHSETGRTRITQPGDITDCDARWFKAADLYTSPPAQRPWVGLTHEDIVIILNNDYGGSRADCIRSAEAKLKERNT